MEWRITRYYTNSIRNIITMLYNIPYYVNLKSYKN